MSCFNPRSREGSDSDGSSTYNSVVLVSIHAPVKGATKIKQLTADLKLFQSTLP